MRPNGRHLSMTSGRPIGGAQPAFEAATRFRGDRLNRYVNENWSNKVGDLPSGYGFGGGALVPALKTGGLSSYQGEAITFSQSGTMISAMTLIGPASFSITGTGGLGLIITLSANGTFTFSQTGNVNLTIGLSGSGTWSITPTGALNLLIPVAGSSSFSITSSANLKGYVGLSGDITPFTELSPQSLAAALLNAPIAEYQESGSVGEAIADAGGAGNPWSSTVTGNTDTGTFGEMVAKKLLKTSQFVALK